MKLVPMVIRNTQNTKVKHAQITNTIGYIKKKT